jgi:hypothetical protein
LAEKSLKRTKRKSGASMSYKITLSRLLNKKTALKINSVSNRELGKSNPNFVIKFPKTCEVNDASSKNCIILYIKNP